MNNSQTPDTTRRSVKSRKITHTNKGKECVNQATHPHANKQEKTQTCMHIPHFSTRNKHSPPSLPLSFDHLYILVVVVLLLPTGVMYGLMHRRRVGRRGGSVHIVRRRRVGVMSVGVGSKGGRRGGRELLHLLL